MSEQEVLPKEDQTALITIEKTTALDVFTTPGMIAPLLTSIADTVREFKGDITTAKGRAEIKSLAFKVTRTKTYIDGIGKELSDTTKAEIDTKVAELTAQRTCIESTRKEVKAFMDTLRDEVRKDLDEWEAEQERIKQAKAQQEAAAAQRKADIQSAIDAYRGIPGDLVGQPSATIQATLDQIAANTPSADSFDERVDEALAAWTDCKTKVSAMLNQVLTIERQQQEMRDREVAQKASDEERQRQESRIRQEQLDRERAERETREANERADRLQREAEEKAKQAELDAKAREEQAKKDAIEQERLRVEEDARQAAQVEADRLANKEHCQKINREALDSLIINAGLIEETAKAVIKAIIRGQIKNVSIKY